MHAVCTYVCILPCTHVCICDCKLLREYRIYYVYILVVPRIYTYKYIYVVLYNEQINYKCVTSTLRPGYPGSDPDPDPDPT